MDGMTLFVVVSTILGITRALPQLVRLLRARHTRGVSIDTSATSAIVSFGWAVYGFWTNQLSISFASSATATIFACITLVAFRFGRHVSELRIAPLWLVILLLFGSVGGALGLSLILPVSVLAANIPQVWVAYSEKNLADLSLGTWLLALAEGLLWGGYGIVQQDMSVLVNNSFLVITSAMIVASKLMHMLKQTRQSETTF